MFLVPLDATGESYRYHHLFQELLQSELRRAEPELVPELLGRATEWCASNGHLEDAIAYAQAAADVDRVASLVERSALPAYQSGRAATVERWIDWLEEHGALERNTAVAVLGGLLAMIWGQPVKADRRTDAAERAIYKGSLPDGSPSIDSWLALLRAQRCQRGVARMRTDAELAVKTLARGSPMWPHAVLLLAISYCLGGEVERADDLFADVAEAGLEVGAPEAAGLALSERAAIAIGRESWVQAEELAGRALAAIRRSRMTEYPCSALPCAVAARVALHRGEIPRAHELLAQAQSLRPRLTYALPYFAVQTRLELARAYLVLADAAGARTVLREIDTLLRRQPDLGTLTAQVDELRASLATMRADAPGASSLTAAELRVLPFLATHLSFREMGVRAYVSRNTVKSHAGAIYRKLNVTSRNGAVERARELGLL